MLNPKATEIKAEGTQIPHILVLLISLVDGGGGRRFGGFMFPEAKSMWFPLHIYAYLKKIGFIEVIIFIGHQDSAVQCVAHVMNHTVYELRVI